ncbi:MAG: alpha/beta hydrolase [Clostridium sp.]|nr:alpha/beta hydrolase [Clostridium sp.]
MYKREYIKDSFGHDLSLYIWDEVENPKGVVQIVHGIAEHMGRYEEFSDFLNKNGYIVYGHDHRGHGYTSIDNLGTVLGDVDPMESLLNGISKVREKISKDCKDLPIFIFGHSMGSFLTLRTIEIYPKEYEKAILSGTNGKPNPLLSKAPNVLSGIMSRAINKRNPYALNSIIFKPYNAYFKPNRTEFDWLNRVDAEVDKYINDEFCGIDMDNDFLLSLAKGLDIYYRNSEVKKIDKEMPILLAAGSKDPVGNMGKGILSLLRLLEGTANLKNVYVRMYKDARHEILFEKEKDKTYRDILNFLNYISRD